MMSFFFFFFFGWLVESRFPLFRFVNLLVHTFFFLVLFSFLFDLLSTLYEWYGHVVVEQSIRVSP